MKIELETLTPIWTGDVDQKSDQLRETGLIGSLRWWYEALVRGLGGYACDPVGGKGCEYDSKKKIPPEEQLCPVCYLFGCTGWARRFRLTVQEVDMKSDGPKGIERTSGSRLNKKNECSSWYFKDYGKVGAFNCSFISLFEMKCIYNGLLAILFKLIENYAALGAKTQLGYGWVKIINSPFLDLNKFIDILKQEISAWPVNKEPGLPSLSEMFFAQIDFKNQTGITATLDFRYDLRNVFREKADTILRHFICGDVRNDRQASKIFCSQAVNEKMRIWGWIPNELPTEVTREQVLNVIHQKVKAYGDITVWREYDSNRDTVTPQSKDRVTFLKSLLGGC